MSIRIRPLCRGDLGSVVAAHVDAWRRERVSSPRLPEAARGGGDALRSLISSCADRPGVVAEHDGLPVGYLAECRRFSWKQQSAVLCRAYAHAVLGEPATPSAVRSRVYQEMYAGLAQTWADQGLRLHFIEHFAGDRVLTDTLFHLGFGAILEEDLRDLAPVSRPAEGSGPAPQVVVVTDPADLRDLQREHMGYYRASPIFLPKDESADAAVRELDESRRAGDVWLGYHRDGRLEGYFIVGRPAGDGEGMLLSGTNTAQLKSAYLRPRARGCGAGRDLLDRSVAWARGQGYDRIFVEHETANILGSAFWRRHFAPYLYVSMRYIDDTAAHGVQEG